MIILFQIIFIVFALFAIFNVWQKSQQGFLGKKGKFFWICFWLLTVSVIIWPESVQKIADYLGIGRGVDLVIYSSIIIIFFVLFKLNIKIEGLKKDLTKIVRQDSLK
ncbi:MAG: DUF2304 domain-containing protein [Patescibacteria group bacterium]